MVRGSKSEDQLAVMEMENNSSEEEKMLINSSCHALVDTEQRPRLRTVTSAAPQVSSESSSSRSLGSTDIMPLSRVSETASTITEPITNGLQQASEETTSPDFSTSSLISCSEHYNGDSLLDPGQMSPHSPSSPDTPEWSLIANGDSFHKVRMCLFVMFVSSGCVLPASETGQARVASGQLTARYTVCLTRYTTAATSD